ncbi:hypothetical protein [Paenibacillus sp. RUD330]|uniref:hypothetical protein n=1 Tax=Paenibacillus sp. RUD330 TaxID=2023772 RepID=UPI000B926AC2|nr:hypothetical protein [Paenibacillus sp. RUD330]ASS64711.1 hypothetical protein CIC07_00250 [Paenibacillus sp. RUD330]
MSMENTVAKLSDELAERYWELLEKEGSTLAGNLVGEAEAAFAECLTPEQSVAYEKVSDLIARQEAERTQRFFKLGYLDGIQAGCTIFKF